MSQDELVQQIIDGIEGEEGPSRPVIRYALAVEVIEEGEDDPSVHTVYSDNMTPWAARGLAWLIERDSEQGHERF